MTTEEKQQLLAILNPSNVKEKIGARIKALEYVKGAKVEDVPKNASEGQNAPNRTISQNKAMWKQHEILADELTKLGVTMRQIFEKTEEFDIPPTKDSVHELWLYFQKHLYPKYESSRDLPKIGDHFQKIHDVMLNVLGEKWHVEYFEFPHDKQKAQENLTGYKNAAGQPPVEYPEHTQSPSW